MIQSLICLALLSYDCFEIFFEVFHLVGKFCQRFSFENSEGNFICAVGQGIVSSLNVMMIAPSKRALPLSCSFQVQVLSLSTKVEPQGHIFPCLIAELPTCFSC